MFDAHAVRRRSWATGTDSREITAGGQAPNLVKREAGGWVANHGNWRRARGLSTRRQALLIEELAKRQRDTNRNRILLGVQREFGESRRNSAWGRD